MKQVHLLDYLRFLKQMDVPISEEILRHPFTCPYSEPETYISNASWHSAFHSAQHAIYAADYLVVSEQPVYLLCRPPGHHAGYGWMGGFCYLNNAALAAIRLRDQTGEAVGILDIDYHYGNGTADIVRRHDGLFYASLHADRLQTYPFYRASEDEDHLRILAMDFKIPPKISEYLPALKTALEYLKDQGCTYLILSVGFDTVTDDPLGGWDFQPESFRKIAEIIYSGFGKDILAIQEGGYNLDLIGSCALSFASGFGG